MESVLQIAAEASRQATRAQALVSNNLANTGTTAFKGDLYSAQARYIVVSPVEGGGISEPEVTSVDLSPGAVAFTGRDLDIAINGDGWMQVITPGGEEVLSRRGDLRVDINGNLTDAVGNQILGDGGPINIPPFSSLTIGADGTISIIPRGENPTSSAAIDRIMLVNPQSSELSKGPDGHIRANPGANLVPDASVQIVIGALETSNVNPISAMVQMIELARSYESHINTMKSANELEGSSASLMRLE